MLGIAILDLIPEALESGDTKHVMLWIVVGFIALFLLERFLPSHCHEVAVSEPTSTCSHEHRITWAGASIGLSVHSLLAGAALGAAWIFGGLPASVGVFIAVILHKPFDALTLTALMRVANESRPKLVLVNVLYATTVPCGVVLMIYGGNVSPEITSGVIAFSAGMFLCISLSDLLPELHFHGHDRISLTAALLLGLALAWGISMSHPHEVNGHAAEHTGGESIILPHSNDPNSSKL